ncbi:phosphopyruvate hydratase [Candidatus Woesearchaeota archaeon]|nr:phosphopyruvate hydratase [Candidatus Woesearchaeota archaeon]
MSGNISKIIAREVLDSRGNPTVEAVVSVGNSRFSAIVPSGASTGIHEALELRDGGKRFNGKGVLKAVRNVNSVISGKLRGIDCRKQSDIDSLMIELDGTANKTKLGANAILAVSLAAARAGAAFSGLPLFKHVGKLFRNKEFSLPLPFFNIINGGRHAGTRLRFQEFMIVPVKAKSFRDAVMMASETYHVLGEMIAKSYGKAAVNVGDEGGFAPPIDSAESALNLLESCVESLGYKGKIRFAMDSAASEFYADGIYDIGSARLDPGELLDYYVDSLIKPYNILSLEDAFEQDDFETFAELKKRSGIQVVGDDLLVTNTSRIRTAIEKGSCNCLLLKVNQIGSLTESLAAAGLARKSRWKVMVSHRSGESEDSFIADLAVGIGCGQIKSGAPCRGERTAKYNQLLRLEDDFKIRLARFE